MYGAAAAAGGTQLPAAGTVGMNPGGRTFGGGGDVIRFCDVMAWAGIMPGMGMGKYGAGAKGIAYPGA